MINRRTFALRSATLALSLPVAAQAAPAGTTALPPLDNLRILSGFPPGGTLDVVARRLADKLRGNLARVTMVENRPGAGGRLAVDELRRSANDGSQMLITPAAMITLYPHLYPKLSYTLDDVTPVCGVTTVVMGLAVGPAVPPQVRTLADYLNWSKSSAGNAVYGSPGAGSPPHFVGALLDKESGIDFQHVPYKGTVPGVQDLVGGQIPAFWGPIGDYLPHLRSGKLRVLVTSGPKRSRYLPDVPTVAEAGYKALEQTEWYGILLPGKAAPEVVQRAAAAVRTALQGPDTAEALAPFGLEMALTSPAELARAIRAEHAAWGPIVKRIGFTPDA